MPISYNENHNENHNLKNKLLWVYLSQNITLTVERFKLIQESYENIQVAFEDNFNILRADHKFLQKLPKNLNSKLDSELKELEEVLEKYQISVCVYNFDFYPLEMEYLSDAPAVLYYQGNWGLLKKNPARITIVGSRNLNHYSETVLKKILNSSLQLNPNLVTVSGLALGIDALTHQISLENNCQTIGVIGSGLDQKSFYPTANWSLSRKIIEAEGLIISEYPPLAKATVYSFPRRNRLLASLSKLTWVVSASMKSGSLITARIAGELGNTVATTPANILDAGHLGNLELLRNGASIIAESQDILDLMNLNSFKINQAVQTVDLTFLSSEQRKVYELLGYEPVNTDFLSEKLEMEANYLASNLTLLELSGLIINTGENNWQRG